MEENALPPEKILKPTLPSLCILHNEKPKDATEGKILPFTSTTFQRMHLCAAVRKNKIKSTVFQDIINKLPQDLLPHHGYHSTCYRKFTAVDKISIEAYQSNYQERRKALGNDENKPDSSEENTHGEEGQTATIRKDSVIHSLEENRHILSSDMPYSLKENETTSASCDVTGAMPFSFLEDAHTSFNIDNITGSTPLGSSSCAINFDNECCIFCDKINKTHMYKKQNLEKYDELGKNKLIQKICEMNETNLLKKVLQSDSISSHHHCRLVFHTKYQRFQNKQRGKKSAWHECRDQHNITWKSFQNYVTQRIIFDKEIMSLRELYDFYICLLKENCENNPEIYENYTMRNFFIKMNTHWKDKLKFEFGDKRDDNLVYSADSEIDGKTLRLTYEKTKADNLTIQARTMGYMLRDEILKHANATRKEDAPKDLQSIINEKNEEPLAVREFFEALIGGPNLKTQSDSNDKRKNYMKTIFQDALFMVTKGKMMTAKHIILGLAVKSMVGSTKLIELLNRHGYVINDTKIREIETDIANSIISRQNEVPEGITKRKNLCTSTVFDNYDEMTETLSGAGSLHETVGICYQNKPDLPSAQTNDEIITLTKKRQRSLNVEDKEIQPYFKKPKIREKLLPSDTETTAIELPEYVKIAMFRDSVWIWTLAMGVKDVPMWIGYNSKTVNDNRKAQTVTYLKNLDKHSTDPATIIETLKTTQRIATECEEKYILVYYDLNIAKPAIQIQIAESPTYDNVFINFGPFHLFMAYFSALGTIIKDSGLAYYLTESNALANGSVNGFLGGKYYNRCKRLHPILAAAMQKLHITEFLQTENLSETDINIEFLANIMKGEVDLNGPPPDDFKDILLKYDTYCEMTRHGEHGLTAQFYMMYVDLVKIYLMMSRAVRLCDIDLFIFCLPLMTDLFFATNHPNYARWMVMYHNKLQNIDVTHPGLKQVFKNGGLSVKRQDIPFSGTPADQTLEQTVNRDAASRLTGITAFTNSYAARLRWTITRSTRAQIVKEAFESVGISKKQDVTADLRPNMIVKNNKVYNDLCEFSKSAVNPFSPDLPRDNLYNISTGKPARPETANYLLNVRKTGMQLRETFEKECAEDENRFEKAINRQKIITFATEGVTTTVTQKNKSQSVKVTCNLFGRLCCLSMNRGIDMSIVLQYPLTPVPLCLSHIDGTMKKTDKSQLLRHLEQKVQSTEPSQSDYIIIDGGLILFSFPEKLYKTFGHFSNRMLVHILTQYRCTTMDLVFDTYRVPSIKDAERSRRSEIGSAASSEYVIQGREQIFPRDYKKKLLDKTFTKNLIKFLVQDWKNEENLSLIGDRLLRVTCEQNCYVYSQGKSQMDPDLDCFHEEADVRMAFHCYVYSQKHDDKNIIIRSGDTDVLIIFLYNQKHFHSNKVWLDFGTSNHRRIIDVSKLSENLGEHLCDALPSIHAFTGTDYTSAFSRKGKVKPLTLLLKHPEFITVFSLLGTSREISLETEMQLSKFVCLLYGENNAENVNEARVKLFVKQFGAKDKPFEKIKNADASLLPPCQNTLKQKILRTNYVAMIWKNAHEKGELPSPLDFGWILKNESYQPLWFVGECVPSSYEEITVNEELDSDIENDHDFLQSSSDESDTFEE